MFYLHPIPVAYKSFNSAPVQSDRHVEIEKSIPSPPIKTDATQSTENSSVYERLEKLKKLYEKELITKDEYDKERQELLDEL